MEQQLKEIVKELRLIRKELQFDNDLHLEERSKQVQTEQPKQRPDIAKQLSNMFR